ncbi:serine hydrolase [Candidatus Protochlamydia sp. W-9]|uniref:serine hydrolase n=1 Tax=Candidatus Protochlamydia sp. W-9 TaxID=1785087 RepID=UPI00130157C3|nr:serine hydrolase [Candidatus Protochlamydia sp. W-9]
MNHECYGSELSSNPDLENLIPSLMKKYKIPGIAVALLDNYKITSLQCYGFADRANHRPITLKTIFQVGSISKPVSAWGILLLAKNGKINLDASVEQYLTRWTLPESVFNKDDVTIRRILNHTAGLSVPNYPGYVSDRFIPTLVESLNGKKDPQTKLKIIQPPGLSFRYSGGGYSLLQLIIEEITAQRFQDYMDQQVLKPLGMLNSSFDVHRLDQDKISLSYGLMGDLQPYRYFTEQAAASLHTTIEDLAIFTLNCMLAFHNDSNKPHLLNKNAVLDMMSDKNSIYGLGYSLDELSNGTKIIFHTGANKSWRSGMFTLPEMGSGIIIMTNSDNGFDLIEDVFNSWLLWKFQDQTTDYLMTLKLRKATFAITFFLTISFLMYLGFFILQLIKKQRSFITKIRKLASPIKILIIAFYLFFLTSWWIIFYSPFVYPGGWIIGAFMPFGFWYLTISMTLWMLFLLILVFFPKQKPMH